MQRFRVLSIAAILGALPALPAFASGGHHDILILNVSGSLTSAAIQLNELDVSIIEGIDDNLFVFPGELAEIPAGPFAGAGEGSEPGFNTVGPQSTLSGDPIDHPGSDFAANTTLYLRGLAITHPVSNLTSTLFYWDGSGAVDFQATTQEKLRMVRPAITLPDSFSQPQVSVDFDGGSTDLADLLLDQADATGRLHRHTTFQLLGNPTETDDPRYGFYLIGMRGLADVVGDATLEGSNPFYVVFGFGEPADFGLGDEDELEALHDAALDWVADNFAITSVPEPASMLMLALGGVALTTRRRRQR